MVIETIELSMRRKASYTIYIQFVHYFVACSISQTEPSPIHVVHALFAPLLLCMKHIRGTTLDCMCQCVTVCCISESRSFESPPSASPTASTPPTRPHPETPLSKPPSPRATACAPSAWPTRTSSRTRAMSSSCSRPAETLRATSSTPTCGVG